jgi:hypothetical protein
MVKFGAKVPAAGDSSSTAKCVLVAAGRQRQVAQQTGQALAHVKRSNLKLPYA